MRTFGLIGYPLSHSFSKKYFTEQFEREHIDDCVYELFPISEIDLLEKLLEDGPCISGLNVTIPYKVQVLPFLNEIDDAAAFIGAVNCIYVSDKDGQRYLKGYNTDAYGFEESLKPLIKEHHQKALIFGDGGAAKAVKYVLGKLGIGFLSVSRRPSKESLLYEDLTEGILKSHTLLVNTTPLGMSPDTASFPEINYGFLTKEHLVYDLVYNPEETAFLRKSREMGATTKNGMEMLYLQAERSWFIWNQ